MTLTSRCSPIISFLLLAQLLTLIPEAAWSQSPAPTATRRAQFISFSPAELFYKAQLGYERQLGQRSAVGVSAFYRYGLDGRYHGWQGSLYYRYWLGAAFPQGLYFQAQANVYNHLYEANLTNYKTFQHRSFDYRGLAGGGGLGLGYRHYVLRRALNEHLLGNALLGIRMQARPTPEYADDGYYPSRSFLGETDATNWLLGTSPGSVVFGLLTLDYQL